MRNKKQEMEEKESKKSAQQVAINNQS